ncbi:MAG TPA: hypothetical protein VFG00_15205 [Acidothermaceae bacterium]|nr:hypothetical protein [Acidothermaceae bacterium]
MAVRGVAGGGTQLALPLGLPDAPALRELSGWEAMLADYRTLGMTVTSTPSEAIVLHTLAHGCLQKPTLVGSGTTCLGYGTMPGRHRRGPPGTGHRRVRLDDSRAPLRGPARPRYCGASRTRRSPGG